MADHQFLTSSRIFIVAGKGGVGKSTVSAALALTAARAGIPTLLVTLGPPLFSPLHDRLTHLEVSPGRALADYLSSRGLGIVSRQLAQSGIVDLVATTAPGIDDLLVLGKIKSLAKDAPDRVIIVDGPAAGHALDLLRSPAELRRAVTGGPIRHQADEVLAMLADPTMVRVILVTTPAMTPVMETIEAAAMLGHDADVDVAAVVVNMIDDGLPTVDAGRLPPTLQQVHQYVTARASAQSAAITALHEAVGMPIVRSMRHRLDGIDLVDAVADELARAMAEREDGR